MLGRLIWAAMRRPIKPNPTELRLQAHIASTAPIPLPQRPPAHLRRRRVRDDISGAPARHATPSARRMGHIPPPRIPPLPLATAPSSAHSAEARTLSVGEELVGETIPLRRGQRVYRIDGLRPSAWYEVKISYPASIPSSFSIRLVDDPDSAEDLGSKNRRLLNTEKIIFKAESTDPVYILVTVEPEGVVAKPNVPERELALFNIVCDELMLGIPHFAWWVGIGALLCIVLALLAPLVLPLHKLVNYEPAELSKADTAKMS